MLVAIIVAMVVQANLSPKKSDTAALPSTQILVATQALATGTRLSAENTRWQDWPQAAVFDGAILKSKETDPKQLSVADSPLRRPLAAGEPVTRQSLIDNKASGNMLAAALDPGMRAVAIGVKPETSVAGFIAPGDRVDVILAYNPRLTNEGRDLGETLVSRDATQTILSNIKVLAVDQTSAEPGAAGGEVKAAKTVTLEVSKADAEKLALAVQMGDISLALRRLGEEDGPAAADGALTTDINTSDVLHRVNDALRRSKANSNTVRVYSGTGVINVPVRADAPPAQQ